MVLFHKLHNLLEALLFFNVEAVAELLFVLPIVHHFCLDRPNLGVALGNAQCANARSGAVWHGSMFLAKVVVYGYLDGCMQIQRLMFCVVGSLRSLVNGREEKSLMANCARD